ncbi:hypothetical protein ACHAWF_006604 [Thalassiosira exigua]
MPRSRRRTGGSEGGGGGGGGTGVSGTYVAPGGGTKSDLLRLSDSLNLPYDAVHAVMNCQGQGVASRSGRRSAAREDEAAAAATADPAMMGVWGDFMNEEMGAPAPAPASAAPAPAASSEPASTSPAAAPSSSAPSSSEEGPREYALPVRPRMRLSNGKKKANDDDDDDVPAPGLLAQTGTLDASVPGRSAPSGSPKPHELWAPTLLLPSVFSKIKISLVATSPTSCHSVAIATNGAAYGWGRNETGQLGLGSASAVVPLPTRLSVGGEESLKFVGAAVGKHHTVLVGENGNAYASGGNVFGQLGINNSGAEKIDKFRKCVVIGQIASNDDEGEEGEGKGVVTIVQATCGENVSALLSSAGHLYTAGASEFGQLGNGETGEHIVTAGKLGFANCAKFVRRSTFVQSDADAAGGLESGKMTGAGVDSSGRVKTGSLLDASRICLSRISAGKNHFVAIEAPAAEGTSHVPRVFSWGSGDYGCLGHGIQADEYTPRLVRAYRGPIFANNHPVDVSAGSNCTLVHTKNGHVYYVGKHKQAGEATMRPALIDALANNGHVVTTCGAGNQTVVCSTKNGVTVSWGHGSHGELGFGADGGKSSSKPKFVNGLDSCLVTSVACGYGHTLFVVRDDDEEDAKALKKVPKVEAEDVSEFVKEVKGRKADAGADEPAKKKFKGKGKK